MLRAEGSAQGPWTLDAIWTTEAHSAARGARRWCACARRRPQRRARRERRRAGRCRLQGDRAGDRHAVMVLRKFEVHAVTDRRGRAGRGEWSTSSTIDAAIAARASAPNIIEAAARALLEVINRIELSQAGTRARAVHRRQYRPRSDVYRSCHAHSSHAVHLVQRQARALGEGHGARAGARAALRLLGVRGHPRLRDAARGGDLPPARPHAAAVRLGEDLSHPDPASRPSRSTRPAAR